MLASAASSFGQVASPVQATSSTISKLGLPIVDTVNLAGSDPQSAAFQQTALPGLTSLLNVRLGERAMLSGQESYALDPSKLTLATESTARVYFIGEGAGYWNTLGFNTLQTAQSTPTGVLTSSAQLIFPNASSTVSSYDPGTKAIRTASAPLLPGDFVDLGSFNAGTTLDFFLISNGANGGTTAFAASPTRNPDSLNHVVSFASLDSPYLMLAFEDMYGGGDKDFNDVVFAVDIGRANIAQLVGAPEPETWAIMISFVAVLLVIERRKKRQSVAEY